MGVLIDTNILIKIEKGRFDFDKKIKGREAEEYFLSAITASEILHGVWRATDPAIKAKRTVFAENILANFTIIPINLMIARVHSQIWAGLQSKGQMIGIHDSWIAASALAYGLSVVTANEREFSRVPGLSVEVW